MNPSLIAGGYIIRNQIRHQLPSFTNPSKADIHKLLTIVEGNYGVISIKVINNKDIGVQDITLYAENQRYLVAIYEIDEDGEAQVRLPINTSGGNGLETVHGESFPAAGITSDFNAVINTFDEFITINH